MTPYYETELGKLYHGDCLEIMPHLEPVDLVLTDPPYPQLLGGLTHYGKGVAKSVNLSKSVGTPWGNDMTWIQIAYEKANLGLMVFCSYHSVDIIPGLIPEAKKAGLFTWFKPNSPLPINNVPRFMTEYVWMFRKSPGLKWNKISTFQNIASVPGGCMGKERIKNSDGLTAHPTQKPKKLMMYLLKIGGESVLDCFSGTGTTLFCCERLNRKWIGIEIEEKYCEIAAKRIEQERKQLKLF